MEGQSSKTLRKLKPTSKMVMVIMLIETFFVFVLPVGHVLA